MREEDGEWKERGRKGRDGEDGTGGRAEEKEEGQIWPCRLSEA